MLQLKQEGCGEQQPWLSTSDAELPVSSPATHSTVSLSLLLLLVLKSNEFQILESCFRSAFSLAVRLIDVL